MTMMYWSYQLGLNRQDNSFNDSASGILYFQRLPRCRGDFCNDLDSKPCHILLCWCDRYISMMRTIFLCLLHFFTVQITKQVQKMIKMKFYPRLFTFVISIILILIIHCIRNQLNK